MVKVTVQISNGGYWDDVPKVNHVFNDWSEVSKFAYHLALQVNKEVRVEHKGNGHYYNPNNSEQYLAQEKK